MQHHHLTARVGRCRRLLSGGLCDVGSKRGQQLILVTDDPALPFIEGGFQADRLNLKATNHGGNDEVQHDGSD